MKRIFLASALAAVTLTGCTTSQQQTATSYQAQIASACSVAMTFAPGAPTIAPWIVGGCGTEEAIADLALNPTSLAWVNGLISQAQAKPAAS